MCKFKKKGKNFLSFLGLVGGNGEGRKEELITGIFFRDTPPPKPIFDRVFVHAYQLRKVCLLRHAGRFKRAVIFYYHLNEDVSVSFILLRNLTRV